jgi:hypothetical protein
MVVLALILNSFRVFDLKLKIANGDGGDLHA